MLYVLENSALNITFVALLIIGLFLTGTFVLWKFYFSRRGKARRKVANLQKKFLAQKINNHDVACQLSKVLRDHLGLSPIVSRTHFPEALKAHINRWENFTEQLTISCYSSFARTRQQGLEQQTETISVLFNDAYFWLKAWPTGKHD